MAVAQSHLRGLLHAILGACCRPFVAALSCKDVLSLPILQFSTTHLLYPTPSSAFMDMRCL
jgi:hypothetical protein